MSAIVLPAIALGGVYLIYEGLTKKKHKHRGHSSSDSRTDSSSRSHKKTRKHHSADSSSSSSSKSRSKSRSRSRSKSSYGSHVKNKTQKNTHKKILTVFYTIGKIKGKRWTYNDMPSGWKVTKKGDADKYTSKYTQMVQFSGSSKHKSEMKKYLTKVFDYLKKRDIVKRFKISSDELII